MLHNKGQGDLFEGKTRIRFDSMKLHNPDTYELLFEINRPTEMLLSIQDVNNMPITCFFAGL